MLALLGHLRVTGCAFLKMASHRSPHDAAISALNVPFKAGLKSGRPSAGPDKILLSCFYFFFVPSFCYMPLFMPTRWRAVLYELGPPLPSSGLARYAAGRHINFRMRRSLEAAGHKNRAESEEVSSGWGRRLWGLFCLRELSD